MVEHIKTVLSDVLWCRTRGVLLMQCQWFRSISSMYAIWPIFLTRFDSLNRTI